MEMTKDMISFPLTPLNLMKISFSFPPSKMSYYKNVFLAFTMINLEEEVWVTFKLVIRKVNGSFLRSFEWHVWTNGVSASKHTIWKNCVSCAIQLNHVSLLDVISYPIATSLISFQYPFHCMFPNWNIIKDNDSKQIRRWKL